MAGLISGMLVRGYTHRSVLMVARDLMEIDDEDRRLVLPLKHNLIARAGGGGVFVETTRGSVGGGTNHDFQSKLPESGEDAGEESADPSGDRRTEPVEAADVCSHLRRATTECHLG